MHITRRSALCGIASLSATGGATAVLAAEAVIDPSQPETSPEPSFATRRGEAWTRAIELGSELSDLLAELDPEGQLMMEVHAPKSGHPRTAFKEPIPADAEGMLAYYAACYREVASIIEPETTEWWHARSVCNHDAQRFVLIGSRKAVQS